MGGSGAAIGTQADPASNWQRGGEPHQAVDRDNSDAKDRYPRNLRTGPLPRISLFSPSAARPMNKSLLALLLPLALAGCGSSSDLKYNEVVTSAFLHNVQRIDRDRENLLHGDFDPDHAAARRVESPAIHIGELEHDLDQVQQLRHSKYASRFASSLSRYYQLQLSYYQQLRHYVESGDKAKQQILAQQLDSSYQTLHAMPDQILATQKQFLERADLLL